MSEKQEIDKNLHELHEKMLTVLGPKSTADLYLETLVTILHGEGPFQDTKDLSDTIPRTLTLKLGEAVQKLADNI